jgi:hypothetical protein
MLKEPVDEILKGTRRNLPLAGGLVKAIDVTFAESVRLITHPRLRSIEREAPDAVIFCVTARASLAAEALEDPTRVRPYAGNDVEANV